MELKTISQVAKTYDISTRMLRYYEQVGLIESLRKEGYSYRVYDETNLKQLQKIIVLRKLQIPVKQISLILNNPDATVAIDIFNQNLAELDNELTALSTIKSILVKFISELEEIAGLHLAQDFLSNEAVVNLTNSLSLVQKNVKERFTMDTLNVASNQLSKLQNIRILHLPPMTVASCHFIGDNPNENAAKIMSKFVKESQLLKMKPDARCIGFDHPINPYGAPSGYEVWVSILDEMNVPSPLMKKKFQGGLYAAHVIKSDAWDDVLGLQDWIADSDEYQSDITTIRYEPYTKGAAYLLEEQLNYPVNVQNPNLDPDKIQIDLLLPIKEAGTIEETTSEIKDSLQACGFESKLLTKNKFRILGFTKYITPELGDDPVLDFWKEVKQDGRLEMIQKYRKTGVPILGFGSHDMDSQKNGGWRYTICLLETDITDVKAFEKFVSFTKKVDASKWVSFDLTKENILNFDSHTIVSKLGYSFNPPISGHFDVFPDGNITLFDGSKPSEEETVVYHWFPII